MSTPADIVIRKFGGIDKLAAAVGRHHISIRKWTYERGKGGTGGLIPTSMQARVMAAAREHGVKLSARDLIGDVQ